MAETRFDSGMIPLTPPSSPVLRPVRPVPLLPAMLGEDPYRPRWTWSLLAPPPPPARSPDPPLPPCFAEPTLDFTTNNGLVTREMWTTLTKSREPVVLNVKCGAFTNTCQAFSVMDMETHRFLPIGAVQLKPYRCAFRLFLVPRFAALFRPGATFRLFFQAPGSQILEWGDFAIEPCA